MKEIYTIKDNKANMFNVPFYSIHKNDAVRSFTRAASDPQTNLNQFPNDFDLYYLGTFDEETSKFNLMETPQFTIAAAACQRPQGAIKNE